MSEQDELERYNEELRQQEHCEPDGMLALAIGVKEQRWPHTMDARKWVDEWMKQIKETPGIATDEGAMLAWFSNAIMAGYDTCEARYSCSHG